MAGLETVIDFVRADGAVHIRECRQCGTDLDRDQRVCPACDANDIAEYEIE